MIIVSEVRCSDCLNEFANIKGAARMHSEATDCRLRATI